MKPPAVVLWTGGKDCALALYRAIDAGFEIRCLATFIPEDQKEFEAHPRDVSQEQATKLGIPICLLPIGKDVRTDYLFQLKKLIHSYGVSTVVTGDIDEVNGFPSWIGDLCSELEINFYRPLWRNDREALLKELISRGIQVEISWVDERFVPHQWIGRKIDKRFLSELIDYSKIWGTDACGENGEFHTMVTHFPIFNKTKVELSSHHAREVPA